MKSSMKASAATYANARRLRWTMTEPERALWALIRGSRLGLRFRRQRPIGPYVVDFYCPKVQLAVEVDGPVHHEPSQMERDARRDEWLQTHGVRILRFSAAEVLERPAAVVAAIAQAATPSVGFAATSPTPLA